MITIIAAATKMPAQRLRGELDSDLGSELAGVGWLPCGMTTSSGAALGSVTAGPASGLIQGSWVSQFVFKQQIEAWVLLFHLA